jgi:hypothetical protein
MFWNAGRLGVSVEDDRARRHRHLKQEASFIYALDCFLAWLQGIERTAADEGFLCIMFSFPLDGLFSNSVLRDFTAFHALQSVVHTVQLASWLL